MKKIIKKKITKGLLLFLFTLFSVTVQGQYDEYGGGSGGCDPDNISATERGGTFDSNGVNQYGIQRTFDHNEKVEVPQSTAYGYVIVSYRAVYTYSCAKRQDRGPMPGDWYSTTITNNGPVGGGAAPKPPCTLQASYCISIGRVLANCACVEKPCAITSCPTGYDLVNCVCVEKAANPCDVSVNLGKNVKASSLNNCSLQLLKEIAAKLGINKFEISSAFRSGADQARAMFNNIQQFGVASQKALYGANGDQVIDSYSTALAAGKNSDEIKLAMTIKINQIGAYNVSNHAGDPNVLTALDIKPSSIPPGSRAAFVDAINAAISNGEVSKFLHPGNSKDPAYHIEIKVKNCNITNCN